MRNLILLLCAICFTGIACKETTLKTKSGWPYKVYRHGSGVLAKPGDDLEAYISVFMNDSLMNSNIYNFTLMDPKDIPPHVPMDPSLELMYTMKAGDSASVIWPLDTIKNLPPGIKPTDKVKYYIGLHKITPGMDPQLLTKNEGLAKEKATEYAEKWRTNKLGTEVQSLANGLKYVVLDKGNGKATDFNAKVKVMYYGCLKSNGQKFDESYSKKRPFEAQLGLHQVITGWDTGIPMFSEGGSGILLVPSDLAYGPAGMPMGGIPADADLVFYVEVFKVY